jgi:glucosamine kinase
VDPNARPGGDATGPLVLGLDVGGSATRAVAASLDGRRAGTGRAGGANPTAHDPATVADHLTAVVNQALRELDPSTVVGATLGMAGAGRLGHDARARAAVHRALRGSGLHCPYRVVGDALAAYVAGTSAADGTVLIAGTGAIAAAVRAHALTRTAGGHGWLLGDDGSGYWLGRAAVRAALADLDARTGPAPLTRDVVRRLLGDDADPAAPGTAGAVVQRVTAAHPLRLARLAPLVLRDASTGDPTATRLVDLAADRLAGTAALVREPGDDSPLVLAGGLLTTDNPLARRVCDRLAAVWPHAGLVPAGDTAAGAAWLALRELPEVPADRLPGLHAAIVGTPAATPR